MPINGLLEFLEERGLVRSEQLGALANCRLGVQGDHWFKSLQVNEPLHVALGGAPLNLFSNVVQDIDVLRRINCHPLFVFNGLNLSREDRPFAKPDTRDALRERAWEYYVNGDVQKATSMFSSQGKFFVNNYLPNTIKILHQYNVDTLTAPYSARAQLAYLYSMSSSGQMPLLHNVWAGPEVLLYGASSVITHIDFNTGMLSYLDLYAVLENLQINSEQFLEISLMAGVSELIPSFPVVNEKAEFTPANYWRTAYDMVKGGKSAWALIEEHAENQSVKSVNYKDLFLRARASIDHHVIFDRQCKARPLSSTIPKDLNEIFGPRLPDPVYFLITQNVLSTLMPANLTSGLLIEYPPYLDSATYRHVLQALTPVRETTLGLLTSKLHPFLRKKNVVTCRWFEPQNDLPLLHYSDEVSKAVLQLETMIGDEEIKHEMQRQRKQQLNELGIHFVLSTLNQRAGQNSTAPLQRNPIKISTSQELMCAAVLHTLQIKGYATQSGITDIGKALIKVDAAFQEKAMTAIDLVRLSALHALPIVADTQDNSPVSQHIALLTRVFSLVDMEHRASDYNPWSGPVDKDLLAFNMVVKVYYRTVRNLFEVCLARLYLGNCVVMPEYSILQRVSDRLPFVQEANTAIGMVLKVRLTQPSVTLTSRFPNCSDIYGDLKKGYQFWGQLFTALQFLNEQGDVDPEIFAAFAGANDYIEKRNKDEQIFV